MAGCISRGEAVHPVGASLPRDLLILKSLASAYISIGCATAFYGFRSYSEALLSNSHKSTQKGLAPAYGLRCAQVPSFQSCSVGTPPRAIHGPSRLSRHPCRDTHCAEPPLGLPKGRVDQDQKPDHKPDQKIASKLAPTGIWGWVYVGVWWVSHCNKRSSSPAAAITCRPTGRPLTCPAGRLIAGRPVRFQGLV